MTLGKYFVIWLIIVGTFVSYGLLVDGYEGGWPFDLEDALLAILYEGGIGFSIATSLISGLYLVSRVRSKSFNKGFGILFLLICVAVAAILPPVVMAFSGRFRGESGMMIYFQAVVTLGVSLFAFVGFTLGILCVRQD